jgi:hypothetical protein
MKVHISFSRPDYPDAGEGACCMGSAARGPENCTCWVPVYNKKQAPRKQGPMRQRDRMCSDCAFRPDSPERNGDERYAHCGEDGIDEVMGGTFLCHTGMRRLLREVHPSGVVLEAPPDAYEPGDPPQQADGSPPELCAGWAAEMKRREAEGEP